MVRFLACSLILVLAACSDDGAPATGTEVGSVSAGTGEEGGSSDGDPTRGTSAGTSDGESASDSATTGGPTSGMTCEQDDDCTLVNDCCHCVAIHVEDTAPPCDLQECFAPTCDANGIPNATVRCRFGTCEIAPVACSPFLVACDQAPPTCGEGTLPSVVDGCWGPCVPAHTCDTVPSCEDCPEDEACIESSTQLGYTFTCEPIDPACAGAPDCACMGTACEDPFVCAPAGAANGADLACECPTC